MFQKAWSAACGAAILAAAGAAAMAAGDEGSGMGAPPVAAPQSPKGPAPSEDVLVLKDGTEIHGRIASENETDYAVKVGGSLRVVEKSRVSEVKRGAPAAEDPAPATPAPAGKGDQGEPKKERKREKRMDGEPAAPLTEDGRAWAKTCIERLQSADPAVQRSAAEALRALGAPVLPLLKEAREGADDAGKQRLERVAGMIGRPPEAKGDRKGPGPGQAPARGSGILEKVKTDLALDDAQARTVGAALLALGRETREALEDARDGLITYEDARTKVSGLRSKLREDLKPTLSADQLTKLDGILDEMGRRMGGGGPKKEPPAKPDAPKPEKPL